MSTMTVGWLIMDAEQARHLASCHLAADLPQRWRHVQGVARRASAIARNVADHTDTLVCAAWLHDIGYAPALTVTGFHPLDGARFLASAGAPRRLAGLVAHHSCAMLEAELRGLAGELAEFDDEDGTVRDALWYCDLTTSPDGRPVAAANRIAEIKRRYGPGHLVTRFITEAAPDLLVAVARTEHLLGQVASGLADVRTCLHVEPMLYPQAHGWVDVKAVDNAGCNPLDLARLRAGSQ